jgi:hypothetical protein
MSLTGKLLAVLNVLAALGAVALLAMAYGKQRSWQYAVFAQDVLIDGLPLDDKQTDDQGNILADDARELPKTFFPAGNPVTQEAEVRRVQGDLQGKLNAAGDKKKQIYLYAKVLTPLAQTASQRDRLMAYQIYLHDDQSLARLKQLFEQADRDARKPADKEKKERVKQYDEAFRDALEARNTDPPGPLADAFLEVKKANANMPVDQALEQSFDSQLSPLQQEFNQAFAAALNSQGQSVGQRKRTIAHLLLNMVDALPADTPAGGQARGDVTDSTDYQRFLTVVGLREAVAAVDDEAQNLNELAAQVEVDRRRQRSRFAVEHQKVVDAIKEKAAEAEVHAALLARKEKQLAVHAAELKKRQQDVQYYTEQLEAARKDTADRLKELRGMSDALYKERLELRGMNEGNQKLEKEIRSLEAGR